MIEYIKNILPRIQQHSQSLDTIETFVDKNWVFIDDNNDHHEYLFLRDKRIIMTVKFVTLEGSWDLLPTGQLLIKRSPTDIIKLEKLFIEKALLILKYSTTFDNPFILINKNLIPDLDVISYLQSLESEYEKKYKPISEQKYYLISPSVLSGPIPSVGDIIRTSTSENLSGIFRYKNNMVTYDHYLVIESNKVISMYYIFQYTYLGKQLQIKQKSIFDLLVGDKLENYTEYNIPTNQFISINNLSGLTLNIKFDENYVIIKKLDGDIYVTLSILVIILIFLGILITSTSL